MDEILNLFHFNFYTEKYIKIDNKIFKYYNYIL